ncbi:dinuclear metal center protein, YbgI/SA1388 family [Methanocella conradii HZ254]|uniref:Dinuclear metal center protein, YbgI/SA1388 family n=1 Tax=Methanocella conradii (strain DSM 24694 / JCM 17849 / CGMCC 1.5162 / HZ254) TaxID=1041930 RepID=H8I6T1_METCZ|nr:Nif3-like dinuclear metal center hexameric protein [Methanocella conradii]AFC99401.1 dinuclear metal center protein, YbgI/SA1388 family [Methanocella conradii HZ254]
MKVESLISRLEEIAPPGLAEEYDAGRIGLILKGSREVGRVAVALDPTPYAIRRAAEDGAGMLVTHHTLIWDPVSRISEELAHKLRLLLDNGLSLYTMHTNYDNAPGGVNDVLAGLIGLRSPEAFYGGRVGTVEEMSLRELACMASARLGCSVEYVGEESRMVRHVATVAGSGFRLALEHAKENRIDVVLSSELKHDVIRGRGEVALVSAPHYYTEAPAMRSLAERLNAIVPTVFIDDPPRIKTIKWDEIRERV